MKHFRTFNKKYYNECSALDHNPRPQLMNSVNSFFQGSLPVQWTLVKAPDRLIINSGTGLVQWDFTQASLVPYKISVQASNIIGSNTVTWELSVLISYSAKVSDVQPNGILPKAKVVTISGLVEFFNGSLPRVVPVDIRYVTTSTYDIANDKMVLIS